MLYADGSPVEITVVVTCSSSFFFFLQLPPLSLISSLMLMFVETEVCLRLMIDPFVCVCLFPSLTKERIAASMVKN